MQRSMLFLVSMLYLSGITITLNAQHIIATPSNLTTQKQSVNSELRQEKLPTKPFTHISRSTTLIFKINPIQQTIPFTQTDAAILQEFISYGKSVVSCNEKAVSVTSVLAESIPNQQVYIKLENELQKQGYVVTQIDCAKQNIVLNISKDGSSLENGIPANVVGQQAPKPCDECTEVQVSQQLSEEFSNQDYGEATEIDFDSSFDDSNFDFEGDNLEASDIDPQ